MRSACVTPAELRWRRLKPEAQPLQSGGQDFAASAADICARSDLFLDVLFAFPESENELVPSLGTLCVCLTIKSAWCGRPQSGSDSRALRWTWTRFPERTGELHEPCAHEPAACDARPAQQASLHIESADTDAVGPLTERIAPSSNAARIVFTTSTEENRALLLRIFSHCNLSNCLGPSTLSHGRDYTKAKSNCSQWLHLV